MKFVIFVLCLVWSTCAGAVEATLIPDASIVSRESDLRFGGLSALAIVDDGAGIVAVATAACGSPASSGARAGA